MITRDLLRRLPKAELHVHLDGSLRPATMIELARETGTALPTTDPAALAAHMRADDVPDLQGYLDRFDLTIPLLQTPEALERVAYEMVEDAAADGVRYVEVRNCPWLNTRRGLTLDEVIAAQLAGLERGRRAFGVRTGLINCSLRHYAPELSLAIAEASVRWRDRGVVAFDLAGGEAGRPPGVHAAAFDAAQAGLLPITIHAGEAAGADSVREAVVRCHAQRIGHGTRIGEDPVLERYVRDRRITIEVNLTSNVQTRAVPALAAHPLPRWLAAGVACTLCTDNWLMSGVTLSEEYWRAHAAFGLDRAAIDRLVVDGFAAAFLPWPEREALLAEVRAELAGTP